MFDWESILGVNLDRGDLDPALRDRVAEVLELRSEASIVSAQLNGLRAKRMRGGVVDEAELRRLTTVKTTLGKQIQAKSQALVRQAVDFDTLVGGLLKVLPTVLNTVEESIRIPLIVVLEAYGLDVDDLKRLLAPAVRMARRTSPTADSNALDLFGMLGGRRDPWSAATAEV
jgi:hypothetical protein